MNLHNIRDGIRRRWNSLSSRGRRIVALFVLGGVIIFGISSVMPQRNAPNTLKTKEFQFTSPKMSEELLTEKLQKQVDALSKELKEIKDDVAKKQAGQFTRQEKLSNQAEEAGGEAALLKEIRGSMGESVVAGDTSQLFAPNLPIKPLNLESSLQGAGASQDNVAPVARPEKPSSIPQPPRSLGVLSAAPVAVVNDTTASEKKERKDEGSGAFLPVSAFEVQLLTGIDAPTGNKAKREPSPILFRVQDLAWLPNEFREDIQGCLILAEGIGELSTERVAMRGISISCIDTEGELVLEQKLLGYVADSDGKAGMRGRVASKAGKLLAETMKVGFIQGLSQFFTFNARSFSTTDSGNITSTPKSDDLANSLAGGVSSGIGQALNKVADYYMDLAEEVFPVIQISAQRKATFIVTQGIYLKFDKKLREYTNTKGNYDEEL